MSTINIRIGIFGMPAPRTRHGECCRSDGNEDVMKKQVSRTPRDTFMVTISSHLISRPLPLYRTPNEERLIENEL
jgi:hypothetical protein